MSFYSFSRRAQSIRFRRRLEAVIEGALYMIVALLVSIVLVIAISVLASAIMAMR